MVRIEVFGTNGKLSAGSTPVDMLDKLARITDEQMDEARQELDELED